MSRCSASTIALDDTMERDSKGSGAGRWQASYLGGTDWEGVSQSRLRLALFGGVSVSLMR